jgi:hypothetical protein
VSMNIPQPPKQSVNAYELSSNEGPCNCNDMGSTPFNSAAAPRQRQHSPGNARCGGA